MRKRFRFRRGDMNKMTKLWKNLQFQTKLFLIFLLLSGIPTLLIGFTAYRKSVDMLRAQTEQDLNVILGQLTASIERQINDFDRFTMLPYYLPSIFEFLNQPYISSDQWSSEEIRAQKTMARLMSAYPSINNSIKGLMIYGVNGSVNGYRTAGELTINPNSSLITGSWYDAVMEGGGSFVITGVEMIDQFSGEPFPALIGSRLLRDEDYQPLAVIAMFISPEFIPKLIRSLELPNVNVTVLDRKRSIIYASDDTLAKQLRSLPAGLRYWEIDVELPDETKSYLGASNKSEYLGWSVHMAVDRDKMLQGSRLIRNSTLIAVITVAVISALVSWLLARGLSKPIHRLVQSMREVERGKFFAPVPRVRGGEIGLLEHSYRRMVKRLDELVQSIEEKERQKQEAEIYALKSRIQPHFLYNTLNSIRMLAILQKSDQIASLIHSLNKLLHANMKLESELISLQDELDLLAHYTEIMSLRYTNVFEVDWDAEPAALPAAVPPMLLQPLLENAIFHGAKGLKRKLHIRVTARREGDLLVLGIWDNGVGFGCETLEIAKGSMSEHIGLQNVNDRIRLRFGSGYGLSLVRREDWTHAMLRMPYYEIGGNL